MPTTIPNASGSSQATTGSIVTGTNTLTLTSAIDFVDGQGIYVAGGGRLPTPPTPALTQAAGSSSFTVGQTIYVAIAYCDNAGNLTLASTPASITIAANGNIIKTTLPMVQFGMGWQIYVGTTETPLSLGLVDGGSTIHYPTGTTTGLYADSFPWTGAASNHQSNVTISAVGISSATPVSNATSVPLISTISSGAGTTSLVLADAATNTVVGVTVSHDDTVAFQAVLTSAASSGPATVQPTGAFYRISSTLNIGSNTTLDLSYANTTIKRHDMTVQPGDAQILQNTAQWTGSNVNIAIKGGTLDGNAHNNICWTHNYPYGYARIDIWVTGVLWVPATSDHYIMTGLNVRINHCNGLTFKDVILKDPLGTGGEFGGVTNFVIEHIVFDYTTPEVNNDGIDILGLSNNGIIRDLRGITGDDHLAFNPEFRYTVKGEIRDIEVYDIHGDGGAGEGGHGVLFLSDNEPVHDIIVKNVSGLFGLPPILFEYYYGNENGQIYNIILEDITGKNESAGGNIQVSTNVTNLTIKGVTTQSSTSHYLVNVVGGCTVNHLNLSDVTIINTNGGISSTNLLNNAGNITHLNVSNIIVQNTQYPVITVLSGGVLSNVNISNVIGNNITGLFAFSNTGTTRIKASNQSLRTELEGFPSRHWKIAECSLSTARTRTPCLRASSMTISPAMTRISLDATAISLPARIAASAGFNPAVPTIAINTMSADGNVASLIKPSSPE